MIADDGIENNIWSRLVNEEGEVPERFKHYNIRGASDKTGTLWSNNFNFEGSLIVIDSINRMAVVDIDGHLLYPELSFRFLNMTVLFGKLFLVPFNNYYHLVDRHGEEIYPGLKMEASRSVVHMHSAVTYYTHQYFSGLYTIRYLRDGQYENLYIDRHGTLYADNLK